MNLNEVKTLLIGTIKTAFTNKKTLDKFDDTTGTLKYNGVPVNNVPVFVADDSPVGNIISFMGNTAPKDYLICDGAIYNIADYPLLAQHMLVEFGSYNYFGGDGETTFAVPDLRGEFLRGTGENSRENQGSGAEVGIHQDGTNHQYFFIGESSLCFYGPNGDSAKNKQPDTEINVNTNGKKIGYTTYKSGATQQYYTARPTNTSVLYCIKYQITQNNISKDMINYSLEEQVIGSWINGKPLYQKTVKYENISCSAKGYKTIGKVTDIIPDYEDVLDYSAYSVSKKQNIAIGKFAPTSSFNIYGFGCTVQSNSDNNSITITCSSSSSLSNDTIFLTLQYTKTTDAENSFTQDMLSSVKANTTVTDDDVNDVIGGI